LATIELNKGNAPTHITKARRLKPDELAMFGVSWINPDWCQVLKISFCTLGALRYGDAKAK
jgi:hypothetical protein